MSQLPAGQLPFSVGSEDDQELRDTNQSGAVLPSGGDSSGLSPAVRQQLEARFLAAGANVDVVASELRARIADIDARDVPEDDPQHVQLQAQRALYVAQVSYVEDHLAVHGVDMSRGAHMDQDANTFSRTTDEPFGASTSSSSVAREPLSGSTSSSHRRRVRVYDTRG